ncbi:MAG: CPBP family intramembrane metalloprotease [Ruminococcus sp.]|nr:CPBP family intramembrane metalloprotease [Ruminococcus sp.]
MIIAFEKNKTLIPITAVVLTIIAMIFMGLIEAVIPTEAIPSAIASTVLRILISALFIVIIKKLFGMKIGIGKSGLVKGVFLYGLFICIAAVSNFIGSYMTPEKSFIQALPWLLLYFIFYMTVGIVEEIIYRGLIFNSFRKYFGESKKGIYCSVFLSATVFGIVHITNLIFAPDLVIATITQVIYAFFFGVLIAVIYFRTENLLPCIILHGISDFISFFLTCFAEDLEKQIEVSNTTDMDIVSALILIGLMSTFLISGLWQLGRIFKKRQVTEKETAGD